MSIHKNNDPVDESNLSESDATSLYIDSERLTQERNDRDRKTRHLLRTTDEINNLNLFSFLVALMMGTKDDAGLSSDEAVSEMASALSIDFSAFRTTINNLKSGEISVYQAARQTRESMDTSSPAITNEAIARAENVVAQYAQTGNPLLELIADKESGGDYNRVYNKDGAAVRRENLTGMTINQVIAWQRNYTENEGSASSAAGKYQIHQKNFNRLAR